MKTRKFIAYFMIFALGVLFTQCTKEGPMGPAGADGTNGTDGTAGVDGNITCLACHSTAVKNVIDAQYNLSKHHDGDVTLERVETGNWGADCQRCHTQEGYIAFAAGEEPLGNIYETNPFECKMCHNIHETFTGVDYAFRLASPIDWVSTTAVEAVDMGNSNTCANCHQSRVQEPNLAAPGSTFTITSTHYGPHHGAQANVVYGAGFAEISGALSYPTAGASHHMDADDGRCTGCHMYDYADGEGGHTFTPSLNACNSCHSSSSTDFDYGGVQTETAALLIELRDLLILYGVVAGDDVAGYHPVAGTFDMVLVQGFFNWVGLEEDRSLGAHNPQYVKALLQNSIDAVNDIPL